MQQMKMQNGVQPSLFDNVTEQEQNKRAQALFQR